MTGFELVAGVIGSFFAAGIVAGVLIVIVLSMSRGRRYMNGGDRDELLPPDDDMRPPRWPGG